MKEICIVFIAGEVASFVPGKYPQYSHAPRDKFLDFIKGIREDYPEYRLRCVQNEGIENWIKARVLNEKVIFANRKKER